MSSPKNAETFVGRKSWSLKMQKQFAIPIYKQYWCVSEGDITEVDSHAEDEIAAREIDASGIDKMIRPETGVRHIAQRFRTLSELEGGVIQEPDFSIRISTYSEQDTEYDKLLNSHRNGGQIPKIYTFGITAATTQHESLQTGFKEFYFFKLPRFLKLFDQGHITACAAYPNGDGSKALYFDIQDLRDNHIIQDSLSSSVLSSAWSDKGVSDDFPTAPGIKNTGQLNLCDFDGGSK